LISNTYGYRYEGQPQTTVGTRREYRWIGMFQLDVIERSIEQEEQGEEMLLLLRTVYTSSQHVTCIIYRKLPSISYNTK